MSLGSEILARRMSLIAPATVDVAQERDLRVPMDDGAVLLADRWVARGRSIARNRPCSSAHRTGAGRSWDFCSGGCWPNGDCRWWCRASAGRSAPRAIRPFRRTTGRAGDAAVDPRPTLAPRPDRNDGAQLSRIRSMGGRLGGRG